jgi:hypothetical protein
VSVKRRISTTPQRLTDFWIGMVLYTIHVSGKLCRKTNIFFLSQRLFIERRRAFPKIIMMDFVTKYLVNGLKVDVLLWF